jgi:endonuclease-8
MDDALKGRTVTAFRSRVPALAAEARRRRVEGSVITAVEARGKHLLVRFGSGAALHTHMGMTGSWHLYRRGSRWQRPESHARAELEAGDVVAVCFVPRVLEIVGAADEGTHRSLSALGPDVLDPSADAAPAVAALRARPEAEIGAALLDQTAVAGIGNIWRSEALHAARVDPFATVAELDDASLTRVVRWAMRLMRASVRGEDDRGRVQVYRRAGRPCRRCGTAILTARQGRQRRSTYWCPACQPRG